MAAVFRGGPEQEGVAAEDLHITERGPEGGRGRRGASSRFC